MKKLTLILFAFAFTSLKAQVGINTTDPKAQLEIKATNQAAPDATDGILIPKVDTFPAVNPTVDQDGMMVYLTTNMGVNLKGFYYWDNANSIWKCISGDKGWSLTGNAGTNVATNFIGTTDNMGLKFKVNNLQAGYIDPILYNTSFGMKSANNITSGNNNSAFGHQSLFSNSIGYYNSALGWQSLYSNIDGNDNSSFGALSLAFNSSGSRNSAFGVASLNHNTTGNDNVALGYYSMVSNTTGNNNVAIGRNSLTSNISGEDNVATGYNSLYSNTTGSYNVANGYNALQNNTTGNTNVAIGFQSLYSNIGGDYNVAVGSGALMNNNVSNNVAVGKDALYSNTYGTLNSAFGKDALYSNTTGYRNSAFGFGSLYKNSTGLFNDAFGDFSLNNNTIGYANSAFGSGSLYQNIEGNNNAAFGYESLWNSKIGSANNAFGSRALFKISSGTGNGGYGQEANPTTTTGWNNIGIGFHSLGNLDGIGNRIFGNEIGYDNIGLGLSAGDRTGNNINGCLFLGAFANVTFDDTNLTNATAIGRYATVNQNNTIVLGAINGINNAPASTRVGIGTYTPSCPLNVVGSSTQFGSWAFYARSGSSTTTGYAGGTSGNFSIIASDRIQATEFNAVSDARIKNIQSRMDSKNALEKINQLQVTNYTYKDWVQKGTAIKTGFIAQEVEQIIPSAVNQATNFIPNIMQVPHAFCVDTLKNTMNVNLAKPIQIKKGDKIRLYNKSTPIEAEVILIDDYNFEIIIPTHLKTDDLFVYGTEVSDFRSVDYDQIHTLSVAAIQELSKENTILQERIKLLEQQNNTNEQRLQKVETALNNISLKSN